MHPLRPAAVSGTWYPASADVLASAVDKYLAGAAGTARLERLTALIAPHAGLMYSGPIAGHAYQQLRERDVDLVVLVGPSHFVGFEGVAVYERGAFDTPFGPVPIDEDCASAIAARSSRIRPHPIAHVREHSLEMQLPFLKRVLPDIAIVPLVMGHQRRETADDLAQAIAAAVRGRRAVLVASTDLSHYHPREKARALDWRLRDLVRAFAPTILWEDLREGRVEACGGDPLVAVMLGAGIAGAESSGSGSSSLPGT